MNIQALLNKWNIKCDSKTLLTMWNEPHRHYHTLDHLNDLIGQIKSNKLKFTEKEYDKLLLTALFHDCIYDPMRNDNEERSAEFFKNCSVDNEDTKEIYKMILDTKSHDSDTKISIIFNNFDMNIVDRDFDKLLEWERGIYQEFKKYGKTVYKKHRLIFLESLLDKHISNIDNILKLIEYVKDNY